MIHKLKAWLMEPVDMFKATAWGFCCIAIVLGLFSAAGFCYWAYRTFFA